MYNNLQNPSYYRSNPFSKEGYMPPIAHKNRKHQDFFSQIPQGEQYLDPTTKKHFKGKAYQSQIQHSGIFSTPQKYPHQNDIARDRGYFRSLNTVDIEGASPNTIISMGVKNKLKAQQQLKRRQRQKQQQDNSSNKMQPQSYWMSHYRSEDQKRRQYILNQLKKGSNASSVKQQPTFASRVNYHNRSQAKKSINNQQEAEELNNFQQKRTREQALNQYEKQQQAKQKFQQIEQQRKLQQRKYENRTIQPIKQYERIQPITNVPSRQYQTLQRNQPQPYFKRQQIYKQQLTGRSQSLDQMQTIIRKPQQYQLQQNRNIIQYKNIDNRQNLKTQLERDIIQKQQNNLHQNYPQQDHPYHQKRERQYNPPYHQLPYDKYVQPKYHPHPSDQSIDLFNYYSKDQLYQKQPKKVEVPQYQLANNKYLEYNRSFGSKQDHRKNNPTNLSYGSPSFSIAGKNVVGY